jgi:hypothetical protein
MASSTPSGTSGRSPTYLDIGTLASCTDWLAPCADATVTCFDQPCSALSQAGYRKKAFLMTKLDGRTKESARSQLEESLARLKTDHIDLVQFHEILRFEDPDRIFTDDGALEALLDARKAGKLRFIGFTGHKDPRVHLYMLEVARRKGFVFDTVQMPLNVMDAHFRSFSHLVGARAREAEHRRPGDEDDGRWRVLEERRADHAHRVPALRDEPARIRRPAELPRRVPSRLATPPCPRCAVSASRPGQWPNWQASRRASRARSREATMTAGHGDCTTTSACGRGPSPCAPRAPGGSGRAPCLRSS